MDSHTSICSFSFSFSDIFFSLSFFLSVCLSEPSRSPYSCCFNFYPFSMGSTTITDLITYLSGGGASIKLLGKNQFHNLVILKFFLSHPFTTQFPHERKYPILQHFPLPPDTLPQRLIPPSFPSRILAHHTSRNTTFTRNSKTTQNLTSLVTTHTLAHIHIHTYIHTHITYIHSTD